MEASPDHRIVSTCRTVSCCGLLAAAIGTMLIAQMPDAVAASQRTTTEGRAAQAPKFAPLPPRRPGIAAMPSAVPARPSTAEDPAKKPEDPTGSACQVAFAALGMKALPNPSGISSATCTVPDPVTFDRIPLADGSTITLENSVTTRCTFALEFVAWMRDDLVPILSRTGAKPTGFAGVGSHECRLRNRQSAGPVSEHASGNAVDLRALLLADGRRVALTGSEAATKPLREALRASICARFTTVLGPGSDGFHEDHIHLDLRARNSAYRLCRWQVQ